MNLSTYLSTTLSSTKIFILPSVYPHVAVEPAALSEVCLVFLATGGAALAKLSCASVAAIYFKLVLTFLPS